MVEDIHVIYPVFLKCYDITSDVFWLSIFENLAYGKVPFGTYIVDNTLRCNYKNREFIYVIDTTKDINVLFDEITSLLTEKLDIKSQQVVTPSDIEPIISWNDIRKKGTKEILIEVYVIELINKYSLTYAQSKLILYKLLIYITLKIISPDDIICTNNFISKINNIHIVNNRLCIEKDWEIPVITNTKVYKQNDRKMGMKWEKHLQLIF